MAKSGKKQQQQKGAPKPITNDPRFAHVHNDPRFVRPKKKDTKVTVDKRFSSMLTSKEFNDRPKVDRYGRRVQEDSKEELRNLYEFEDSDQDSDDDNLSLAELEKEIAEDEENLADEKIKVGKRGQKDVDYDPMRGKGVIDSSDSEDTDAEDTVDEESSSEEEAKIPEGEPTYRLAAVNMDWDRLKAVDILKVLNTFKPPQSVIKSVAVYPSEFGKERMAKEDIQGPPKEIFDAKESEDQPERERDEDSYEEEFDQEALRKYQIERLRYYYAVIECDNVQTAAAIYKACDGNEYEASANFFDLRYIPDDMTFDDEPREVATFAPEEYHPSNFSTEALQHTKVKLTWDADDYDRIEVMRRNFTEQDIEEMDFNAYLASSDDDDDDDDNEDVDALREKYRKLLENSDNAFDGHDHAEEGDMEVTFAPGLTEAAEEAVNKRLHGDEENKDETTLEKYMRKQREKRKAKKERRQQQQNAEESGSEEDEELQNDAYFKEAMEEIDEEMGEEEPKKKEKSKKKNKKSKEERQEQQRERAELELLMGDKKGEGFDMRDVMKREKAEKKKNKKLKKKAAELEGAQEDFEINVNDPRFAALHESHHFAIDPNNPQFKKTKSMQKLMSSRQEKIKGDNLDAEWKKSTPATEKTKSEQENDNESPKKKKKDSSLSQLVASVKRKGANASSNTGKRQKSS
ncbi:hypothetical protein LRAMOSA03682 [Lichtheimia ramosa]|uniref:Uncharacterized protein n=1 Tax=Lichtheimia ramosa TaxID=688394 RepID=A0A077WVZ1_9FUNG|nr:hypothetical protein LRAMOSA03682 [Lichtheimia ramosa]